MVVDVFTLTDDDEGCFATFRLRPDARQETIDAEFIEGEIENMHGKKRPATIEMFQSLGVFDELEDDAIGKFDPHTYREESFDS